MKSFLYNLILTFLVFPVGMIILLFHVIISPKNFKPYLQKLSIILPSKKRLENKKKSIWLHAVSVGEMAAIDKIIELMSLEGYNIYLSCTTMTGFSVAEKKYKDKALLFYYPFDLYWMVKRFIEHFVPDLIVMMEIEIWPNFVNCANRKDIPILLINGRMGEKEFRRYKKFRWFFKDVLSLYDKFLMQSEIDTDRMKAIGGPPDKIKTFGNIKFDVKLRETDKQLETFKIIYPASKNHVKLILASSHRGEEAKFLPIYSELQRSYPELRLILVPRHPHRSNEVSLLCRKNGLTFVTRTSGKKFDSNVWLIDTIGELMVLFQMSDIVVMGGTFLQSVGGHNIIEPALVQKPILIGPHMENFIDIRKFFRFENAVVECEWTNLHQNIEKLIKNEEIRKKLGEKAFSVIEKNKGVSEKTFKEIKRYLD